VAANKTDSELLKLTVVKLTELQSPNGSWDESVAKTSNSIRALTEAGVSYNSISIQNAASWLKNHIDYTDINNGSTNTISVSLIALIKSGISKETKIIQDGINWLKKNQNDDGYWGRVPGEKSTTAISSAALALVIADSSNTTESKSALDFIYNNSCIGVAYAVYALETFVFANKTEYINKAKNQILKTINSDNGWGASPNDPSFFTTTSWAITSLLLSGYNNSDVIDKTFQWIYDHTSDSLNIHDQSFTVTQTTWPISAISCALQVTNENVQTLAGSINIQTSINKIYDTKYGGWHWWSLFRNNNTSYYDEVYSTAYASWALYKSQENYTNELSDIAKLAINGQNNDGGWGVFWGSNNTGTSTVNHTIEALIIMVLGGYNSLNTKVNNGINYVLDKKNDTGIDVYQASMLCFILFKANYDINVLQNLITWIEQQQNNDGGWGTIANEASTVAETSLVLISLSSCNYTNSYIFKKGTAWLHAAQNLDGGWGNIPSTFASNTINTSQAIWALSASNSFINDSISLSINSENFCCGNSIEITLSTNSEPLNMSLYITDPSLKNHTIPNVDIINIDSDSNELLYHSNFTIPPVCSEGTYMLSFIVENMQNELYFSNNSFNVFPSHKLYYDSDNDGFGDDNILIIDCNLKPGYVLNNFDCDDDNPNINPDAIDIIDGQDNDCDGYIDEGDRCFQAVQSEMKKYDPNGDGIIGLKEIIYYLQVISGIK